MRYALHNRYQDGGWKDTDLRYARKREAKKEAKARAAKGMFWGMVRVVDLVKEEVVKVYPAG